MSSVGDLTISIGSLFHEMGSHTENAAFLWSKRKLRRRNLKSFSRRSRSDGASKNSARGKSIKGGYFLRVHINVMQKELPSVTNTGSEGTPLWNKLPMNLW